MCERVEEDICEILEGNWVWSRMMKRMNYELAIVWEVWLLADEFGGKMDEEKHDSGLWKLWTKTCVLMYVCCDVMDNMLCNVDVNGW